MAEPATGTAQARLERTTTQNGKDKAMATTTEAQAPAVGSATGGGRKRLLLVAVAALLVAALAAYVLVLRPSQGPHTPPEPVPGAVVPLDKITVNLAGGHFLQLGLALQATADAGETVDGSKALDLAIKLYSGRTITELSNRTGRERVKTTLVTQVEEAYERKVYDVYLTTFVMQ